jgi:hypothetical protein
MIGRLGSGREGGVGCLAFLWLFVKCLGGIRMNFT